MTKLTSELQEAFIKMRKNGLSIKRCCEALGIDESLYYIWMNLGKRDEERPSSKYFKFFEAVNRSQAEALAELMAALDNAAKKGNVNALIIRGQHQFPEEFPRENPKEFNIAMKPTIQQLNEFYDLKEKEKKKQLPDKKQDA